MLDRFFAVLTITPSFLVRFWPIKCRIEALNVFFRMVQGQSVQFGFRSSQRSGQTMVKLGQPWSNLVNFGQTWSTLVGFREMCPGPRFGVICRGGPSSGQAGLVRAISFCVPTPEKILWVKNGVMTTSLRTHFFCEANIFKIKG